MEIDLEEESVESEEYDREDAARERWEAIRVPIQQQPGKFEEEVDFYVPEENERLSKKFKESGLQIIVKMASIELSPEKPEISVGGWHVSFQWFFRDEFAF